MFHRVKTFLIGGARPFGVLAVGLAAVGALTAAGGIWHHRHELLANQKTASKLTEQANGKKEQTAQTNASQKGQTASEQTEETDTPAQSQGTNNSAATAPSQSVQAPSPSAAGTEPVVQTAAITNVTLRINGSEKGTVALPAGSNHCEVLSHAFQNGQIGSLDMRFSSQYGTQTVYVVDGIGDSNTVWWTYTVNGASPPHGCSHTKVRNGDSVNWQYIKR